MTTVNQTRDQKLATYAARCIAHVKGKQSDFKSQARNLPGLIMTNGLGQALAFIKAKGQDQLYGFISGWVSDKVYNKQDGDLLDLIINNNSLQYRRAMQEAMALSAWLKRFAEASKGQD